MHQSQPLGMKARAGTKDASAGSNEFFAGQFGQVWSKAIPFNRETVMQWEKKTIIELGQQSHNPSNVSGKKKAEHEVDSCAQIISPEMQCCQQEYWPTQLFVFFYC